MRIRAFMSDLVGMPTGYSQAAEWPLPTSLEWMPSGEREIEASVNDEARKIKVACDESDAARLDAQLQEMLAKSNRGEASRPFIDFDHEGKEAAAIPVRFFWSDGIRLAVEWTDDGAESLRGRCYSYFSPEFLLGENGHPSALPDYGPIGALVNTPAFQNIERLAASKKIASASEGQPKVDKRMKLLLAALAGAKLIPAADNINDEQASTAVVASLAKRDSDLSTLSASLATERTARETAEASLATTRKQLAELAVEADVKAGRLKDDATLRAKWVDAYTKDFDGTKAMASGFADTKPAPTASGVPLDTVKGAKEHVDRDKVIAEFNAITDAGKRAKFYAENKAILLG